MTQATDPTPAVARQRWRVVFSVGAVPPDGAGSRSGDDLAARWEAALLASGLPVVLATGPVIRPRIAFALPLPAGVAGERELVDVLLTERTARRTVRERLAEAIPGEWRLVDLFDVWTGAPSAAASLAAADYRVGVEGATPAELAVACDDLLASTKLQRIRSKGEGRSVAYDLRPLVLGLRSSDRSLRMRLRLGGNGPAGRPDEVVRALADALGRELVAGPAPIIRERLLEADEVARALGDG